MLFLLQELEPAVGESLLKLWDAFPHPHGISSPHTLPQSYDDTMQAYEALDFPYYVSGSPGTRPHTQQQYWNPRGRPIHGGGGGYNPAGGMPYNMSGFNQHLPYGSGGMMHPSHGMHNRFPRGVPPQMSQRGGQMPMYYNQKHFK